MTFFDKISLVLAVIIVLPVVVYLCMKLGTVGFYRGKEAINREDKKNCYEVNNDEEIKS